ncbi:S-DNA-T family DNA segregation ATPase FtsK/SpoIIIE [Kitasatospora sp. MAP12-15]|uniref:type VII secretion protein EccCa n=1 Tax=unclassified Kitasatospora TaxID=2633591 RepID=UPI0024772DBC|nr:type VII secretion protein EccCa [Kitasatospora sp. MAP12-44]MDH6113191.1 S-DNA-T family DNA segregation ATPase FtsK/SpoIIIE [Kitasatospora sp. MAP12-44]
MSVVTVKRPARAYPPVVPDEPVELITPPELGRAGGDDWMMSLLPLLGMGGSAAFFFMPGSAPMMKIMGVMMVASTAGMGVAQIVKARKGGSGGVADQRRDYLKYLQQMRRQVRRTAERQRGAQLYLHPEPDQLWSIVAEGRRLWERRPGDPDFAQVRLGRGPQQLATPLVAPQTAPMDELEPLAADAMANFLKAHGTLQELPLAVSLRAFYHVTVCGDPDAVHGNVRAIIAQLTTLHSPDDLVLAVAAAPGALEEWEWVKWLPHTQHRKENDGAGSRRLIAPGLGELELLLADELSGRQRFSRDAIPTPDQPHLVVVLDNASVPPDSLLAGPDGVHGVTVIEVVAGELDEPTGHLVISVNREEVLLQSASGASYSGAPDSLSVWQSEALARQLAPYRISAGGDDEPLLSNLDFTDLMGVGDAGAVDVGRTWRPRAQHEKLRVPIGVGANGELVHLDIKEAALEGMGPHGLCVGATGSGKSELLRTLVLGLAMTHSSETLNFVLADFKGGATFAGMADMPHTSAVITNLEGELTLVDRMRDAIEGELNRRQELLRSAGNYANLNEYERARAAGAALDPLPSLVLIIDEFSELLTAKPDFIDMFIQIGRIGRSLGVHLLLASQRLEEGKLRGLDTFLSYRIGLRTFSAAESRAAIGAPDAYHLPPVPGVGYLKFGTDVMDRFKAAYVSGPYRAPGQRRSSGRVSSARPVLFTAAEVPVLDGPAQAVEPEPEQLDDALVDTVLDVIVQRMVGQGPAAHQVWLPPLDEAPSLDQLVPPLQATPERGLTSPDFGALGRLVVPVGIVDRPREQRRDVLYQDYSGAAGHGLVVGGPQSGKSTLIRTTVAGFAVTHTPVETQFYLLDLGGGGFQSLQELPHVGGVAGRLDTDKVRRMVSEVYGVLNRREELFRATGIDSMTTYRTRRAAGHLPEEAFGDVFLVIDGWLTFRQEFEALEPVVADIAQRGLGYGVHLVLTASRYAEVRPALKDLLQNRTELRLGDPMESEIDRKVAQNVPSGAPGRGLTAAKLHFLAGLPRLDGASTREDLAAGVAALVETVAAAWSGPRAPQVRMLPRVLDGETLPKGFEQPKLGVAFGIDEVEMAPVFVNFETDPLFIVFGESESGKSALLRMLIKQITERYPADQAGIVVGDYRRALLGAVPPEYLVEYAAAQPAMSAIVDMLRGACARRLPGPDVTAEQLRNRSWYTGKDMFVIVDDYELVATSSGNPMAALAEFLPFARDIGLRVIIARSAGGAGRSMFEPVMQRMRELGGQGVLLSGNRDEGVLLGTVKPQALPPGRGVFVSRRMTSGQTVQTGWLPIR